MNKLKAILEEEGEHDDFVMENDDIDDLLKINDKIDKLEKIRDDELDYDPTNRKMYEVAE